MADGEGVGLVAGDGVGVLEGVALGEGVGLAHATGLAVIGTLGIASALGLALAKYKARGTMIMPTMTVRTNVTAPHSRLKKAQLTSREF